MFISSKKVFLIFFVLFLFLLFQPALSNFFLSDDFYNFSISQAKNLKQFANFFTFKNKELPFYRPLPLQSFYFLANKILSTHAYFYHLTSFAFYLGSIYLCYHIISLLTRRKSVSILATLIYTFSSHHILRVAWITQIQENMLAFFAMSSIWFFIQYLKKEKNINLIISFIALILSFLSKETAIIIPFLLLILFFFFKQKKKKYSKDIYLYFLLSFILLITYLYLRIIVMGTPGGYVYQVSLSLSKLLNNTFWYSLWSLNVAESFVDFIGPGIRINPRLLNEFRFLTYTTAISLILMFVLFIFNILKNRKEYFKKNNVRLIIFAIFGYIVFLSPVLTLPWHKFAYSLTLPHFFMSLFLGLLLLKFNFKSILFLFVYISLFFVTNSFNYQHHWIFKRGKISKNIYTYFKSNYSELNNNKIYFVNSEFVNPHWRGESKQIALAMFEEKGFNYLFPNNNMKVYFQDLTDGKPEGEYLVLKAKKFIN